MVCSLQGLISTHCTADSSWITNHFQDWECRFTADLPDLSPTLLMLETCSYSPLPMSKPCCLGLAKLFHIHKKKGFDGCRMQWFIYLKRPTIVSRITPPKERKLANKTSHNLIWTSCLYLLTCTWRDHPILQVLKDFKDFHGHLSHKLELQYYPHCHSIAGQVEFFHKAFWQKSCPSQVHELPDSISTNVQNGDYEVKLSLRDTYYFKEKGRISWTVSPSKTDVFSAQHWCCLSSSSCEKNMKKNVTFPSYIYSFTSHTGKS